MSSSVTYEGGGEERREACQSSCFFTPAGSANSSISKMLTTKYLDNPDHLNMTNGVTRIMTVTTELMRCFLKEEGLSLVLKLERESAGTGSWFHNRGA